MASSSGTKTQKPWYAFDAQTFTVVSVILMTGIALFYRMTHPTELNDKLLDMMLTLLFGTAFVGIVNFQIGSSRGAQSQDEAKNEIVAKLTSAPPAGPVAPVPSPVTPITVASWWSLLYPAEQAAIEAAAVAVPPDTRVQAILTAFKSGKAEAPDLTDLVTKELLTQARADEIKPK